MPISFLLACKKFFMAKEGQTLAAFRDEVKLLSEDDVKELRPLLSDVLGEEVTL